MFTQFKRAKRDPWDMAGAGNRLAEAVLKGTNEGLFLMDIKGRILLPVSPLLAWLCRRQDFTNLTFEKLLAPLVSAKTLTLARSHIAELLSIAPRDAENLKNPLERIDVKLKNLDGSVDKAHYRFEFDPVFTPGEPHVWYVRVADVTAQVEEARELQDLRGRVQTQGEILHGVLQMGGARFGTFMQKTDAAVKTIAAILKKAAREEAAFRQKLEEILNEVDRVRREAAAFRLTQLESAARVFEDALHELRGRSTLSGSDFLPLAVKQDQMFGQFSTIQALTVRAGLSPAPTSEDHAPATTAGGTAIMEAPRFAAEAAVAAESVGVRRSAPVGSLENTLQMLTDHVAQEQGKKVKLETVGLELIPRVHQAMIKNVAIQLIRNAVMHGIEMPFARHEAGKPSRGTLRLQFRSKNGNFELLFEDDGCGLNPDEVRAVAVARGILTQEAADRLRDRDAFKLIFRSRFTTLASSADDLSHGKGMSLVRRYVQDVGGKIALASRPGHETRFKVSLPVMPAKPAPAMAAPQGHAATPDESAAPADGDAAAA
jgi:signal transduction histidine kinase